MREISMDQLLALFSIILNVTTFLVLHRKQRNHSGSITANDQHSQLPTRRLSGAAIRKQVRATSLRQQIIQYSQHSVSQYGADYTTLPVFLCLNYMLPYFMWPPGMSYHTNTLTGMRLIGMMLCIPLLLVRYWPTKLRQYLPTYWHMTIAYVLPLSVTFTGCVSHGTTTWLINVALSILLLGALVDCRSFVILGTIGSTGGLICYRAWLFFHQETIAWHPTRTIIQQLLYTVIFATSISFFFCRRRKKVADQRLVILERLRNVIGTEIHNLLTLSNAYAASIRFASQQMEVARVLPIEDNQERYVINVNKSVYETSQKAIEGLVKDNNRVAQTINRVMSTLCSSIDTRSFTNLSMQACVNKALAHCTITTQQRENISLHLDDDFQLYGAFDDVQNILLNLIENTYQHSQKDFTINIWLANHRLHVRDSGSGISKAILPHIFKPFFTTATPALGIGLSFCKLVMEALGGIIVCKSKQGQASFTEFILVFPRIDSRPPTANNTTKDTN